MTLQSCTETRSQIYFLFFFSKRYKENLVFNQNVSLVDKRPTHCKKESFGNMKAFWKNIMLLYVVLNVFLDTYDTSELMSYNEDRKEDKVPDVNANSQLRNQPKEEAQNVSNFRLMLLLSCKLLVNKHSYFKLN